MVQEMRGSFACVRENNEGSGPMTGPVAISRMSLERVASTKLLVSRTVTEKASGPPITQSS